MFGQESFSQRIFAQDNDGIEIIPIAPPAPAPGLPPTDFTPVAGWGVVCKIVSNWLTIGTDKQDTRTCGGVTIGHDGGNSFPTPPPIITPCFPETPALTVAGTPSSILDTPLLSTSAFSITCGDDTHASTDWRVIRDSDKVIVFQSLANTVDLLSIKVPSGILEVSTTYTFGARHTGDTLGNRAYASVTGTTVARFPYENYLAVAHDTNPFVTIYGNDVDTSTKLPDPTGGLPAGSCNGVAFSADGNYMAVAYDNGPFITIYKRTGDAFTKLANPVGGLPLNEGNGVAFSADGVYLAVAHASSPHLTIYKRNGDRFTKLHKPSVLPTGAGQGVAFSADGIYLAVAHTVAPYMTIYKRAGDVFTKLADPTGLAAGTSRGVAFSQDGSYMAVASTSSPFITIYKRNGDTFTKLADPVGGLPTGIGRGVAFSADGVHLAVAHTSDPNITIYKRSGVIFTKLNDPDILPDATGFGVAFSADGGHMAVANVSNPPFITIYKRNGDTFTKLADPVGGLPTGNGRGVAYYPGAFYPALAKKP